VQAPVAALQVPPLRHGNEVQLLVTLFIAVHWVAPVIPVEAEAEF